MLNRIWLTNTECRLVADSAHYVNCDAASALRNFVENSSDYAEIFFDIITLGKNAVLLISKQNKTKKPNQQKKRTLK